MATYHVLNGDSLKEQFPERLAGEIIVARECLVDGPVDADDLEELFAQRAKFMASDYRACSEAEYYSGAVVEFAKVKNIPPGSTVHLWFEDDLFCQVNFWFVAYLLFHFTERIELYLVRPEVHTPYGFGGLSTLELEAAFDTRISIADLEQLAQLWRLYSSGDLDTLLVVAKQMQSSHPFILRAVEAHVARMPAGNHKGRPAESLMAIMEDLQTRDFASVFREFNQREPIYGFGDLQVKRIYDQLVPGR